MSDKAPSREALEAATQWCEEHIDDDITIADDGPLELAHLLDTMMLKARLEEHQIECKFCHAHNGLCKRYSDLERQLQERGERDESHLERMS